jgi:lipopolysaccharide export system permease protein
VSVQKNIFRRAASVVGAGGILDWYILRQFLGTFFYANLVLALIANVIDYSQRVEDFVEHNAPTAGILRYYGNFTPHIAAMLYPLFIFIAAIFFTSKLAYRSELIAAQATGTSFPRLLRPYIVGGCLLGALSLWANHFVVPAANRQRLAFENQYVHDAADYASDNIYLRLGPDLFVGLRNFDFPSANAYHFVAEHLKGGLVTKRIWAGTAHYDSVKNNWLLFDVVQRENNGLQESVTRLDTLRAAYAFTPADLTENRDRMQEIQSPELAEYIEKLRIRGSEALPFNEVELHKRTAQPFAGLILTLIGACIASRKVRGGSGLHLAIGIAISAGYIMAMQFSTTLATKVGLNAFVAVWIPNLVAMILLAFLFWRRVR